MADSSGFLATRVDTIMLEDRQVYPARAGLALAQLPLKSGTEVFQELGGRLLIKYLPERQVGLFNAGGSGMHYTTPTVYPANELNQWLLLPSPQRKRMYVLLLDPRRIAAIRGPQSVAGPGGIQYVLPDGFRRDAIVVPGAPDGAWELELA